MMRFVLDCLRTSKARKPKDGRQADVAETDERVLGKSSEIRELENAVTVENLELQEQQSDRKELEETLLKLAKHKEKLIQQIKEIRQLCYEESQQILSLQAEEVQRESQVEEYERELARARWRLRKLKEEVKQAKRKMEEAGERNCPLQDSIRQSYEEILQSPVSPMQEEHTLCSVSGGAVTPESQLDGSTSPADTAEDEPLPMRPWGRSQSLPAYADLIMVANGAPFCNNLADTREEVDDSSSSSPKMDRSNLEDDPEDGDVEEEGGVEEASVLTKLDFYQVDPFAHCHAGHELFDEDLFLRTDASDGFASDPFKGSDPFAADILFPEPNVAGDEVCDEVGTGPSGAENRASTGTQCFESEFPDDESDVEIGDSREDLDALPGAGDRLGFQPIRSSSEELGPGPVPSWRSRGHCSVESDPNGYELDLGAVSPPSDIQERSLASPAGEFEAAAQVERANGAPELVAEALLGPGRKDHAQPLDADPEGVAHWRSDIQEEQPEFHTGPESPETDLNLDYEPTSRSSFDPYGFKLSPEHSSRTLFDPDEAELSPVPGDQDLAFDPECRSSRAGPLSFYAYEMASSQAAPGSDPYGFKLSLEKENQEVPEPCDHDNAEDAAPGGLDGKDKGEALKSSDREALWLLPCENQEVLDPRHDDHNELPRAFQSGNREGPQSSSLVTGENVKSVGAENLDFLNLCSSPENQEVVDFLSDREVDGCDADNQQVLDFCRRREPQPLDLTCTENREVLDSDGRGNEEAGENRQVLLFGGRWNQAMPTRDRKGDEKLLDSDVVVDNQEVPDSARDGLHAESDGDRRILEPESKSSASDSGSDGDVASEELLGVRPADGGPLVDGAVASGHRARDDPCDGSVPRGDLALAFGAGGYVGCPDVAEDLRPLRRRHARVGAEPLRPLAPVRPPRPSLRAKEKAESPTQGIDLK